MPRNTPRSLRRCRWTFRASVTNWVRGALASSPPIANAGPNQLGVPAGTITLNGSGSYDPLGEALTYQWTQISGPPVTLVESHRRYHNLHGGCRSDLQFPFDGEPIPMACRLRLPPRVSAVSASSTLITQFFANPANITAGSSTTLIWVTQNATSVSISGGVGNVNPSGSTTVSPSNHHYLYVDCNRPTRYGDPGDHSHGGRGGSGRSADCPL